MSDKYKSRRTKSPAVKNLIDEITTNFPGIDIVNKNLVLVSIDGCMEEITPKDVIRYFYSHHGMNGMRNFANVSGDWRMIEHIAGDMKYLYSQLNPDAISCVIA